MSCGVPLAMMWPWLKTRTRRASVRITSITCSTMTRVTPRRWISRTSSIARWISPDVRPASASSSSMSRGSVASTRAISSRLRPGVPRLRARCSVCAPSPVISMILSARSRAAPRRGWRRKAALAALVEARRHAVVPQFQQPARLEAGDQHDDRAVDNVGEAGAAAAEPGVGGGLQGDEDRRAQERPQQRAGAAQRGGDDELHRDEDAEPAVGIDEAGLERVERAGERREGGAQHERIELVAPHRHAEAPRRALVRANGAEVIAEPAPLHLPD